MATSHSDEAWPPIARPRWETWLFRGLALVASLILFLLMVVTFVDVVGRYAFNMPLPGAFELTEIGMAVLVFAALPLVSETDEHITVDIFQSMFKGWMRTAQQLFVKAVSLLCLTVLCWRLWVLAGQKAQYGDATMFLHIPLAPAAYFLSAASGFSAFVVLLSLVTMFRSKGR